jgi:hypothetical protein
MAMLYGLGIGGNEIGKGLKYYGNPKSFMRIRED